MDTSSGLLDLLQDGASDEVWQQLVDLYEPLIRGWLRRQQATASDTDDVVQDVLAVVVRRLPEFQRQRTGSFRSWLRTIAINCLRDHWRKANKHPPAVVGTDFGQQLAELANPDSSLSRQWDRDHDQHVFQYLLDELRPQFSPRTWQAFTRVAVEGESPDEVAQALEMTTNAVFIAKSRVLSSLRQRGQGLID